LNGKLIALPDSQALPNALVMIDSAHIKTTADREGRFVVTALRPGDHVLEVRLVGFHSAVVPFRMAADRGASVLGGVGWVCAIGPVY